MFLIYYLYIRKLNPIRIIGIHILLCIWLLLWNVCLRLLRALSIYINMSLALDYNVLFHHYPIWSPHTPSFISFKALQLRQYTLDKHFAYIFWSAITFHWNTLFGSIDNILLLLIIISFIKLWHSINIYMGN